MTIGEKGKIIQNERQIASSAEFLVLWVATAPALNYSSYGSNSIRGNSCKHLQKSQSSPHMIASFPFSWKQQRKHGDIRVKKLLQKLIRHASLNINQKSLKPFSYHEWTFKFQEVIKKIDLSVDRRDDKVFHLQRRGEFEQGMWNKKLFAFDKLRRFSFIQFI